MLWTPVGGTILNDVTLDWVDVAVWAFLGGGLYGAVVYFSGRARALCADACGGRVTYRQARHLSPLRRPRWPSRCSSSWPVRLAVYGEDVFRAGRKRPRRLGERVPLSSWSCWRSSPWAVSAASRWACASSCAASQASEGLELLLGDRVGVLLLGESAFPHVGGVGLERALRLVREIGVALDEARRRALVRPSRSCQTSTWPSQPAPAPIPIVGTVSASVSARRSAPAPPRARSRSSLPPRARARPRSSRSRLLGGSALRLEAAEHRRRLGRQADVSHHRDARADDRAATRESVGPAPSSLTASAPASFTKRTRSRRRPRRRPGTSRTACRR